jgi:hypothetical protein
MISISVDTKAMIQKLQDLSTKGIRYAVAMAMTWTAKDAKAAFDAEIQSKIDRPRPITKGATRYKIANKDRTEYMVFLKGDDWDEGARGKEVNPNRYLRALVLGGYRANKKSEARLRAKGILPPGWQLQPGDDAPLDAYGNISGGRYTAMLSALRAFNEQGYKMNFNTSGKTHRNPARDKAKAAAGPKYFVLWSIKDKTPTGIYTRKGKKAVQIWKFVPKRAKYNKTLDFRKTIELTFHQVFEKHFREGLQRMLVKVSKW